MNLEKERLALPLVTQVEEGNQTPIAVEEMEEEQETERHNQNQEYEVNAETTGVLVIHQEPHRTEKVQEAINKQAKRTFRRLTSPTRNRRPLREVNGNEVSQLHGGKIKVLIRDEEMEEANTELIQWKKTKPMNEIYSAEVKGEVTGSFLKGTPQGS